MLLTYSKVDLTSTTAFVGDLHINSSLSHEFDSNRLRRIAEAITSQTFIVTLILSGDTFDRNSPSLLDIQSFYSFLKQLPIHLKVFVFAGNHDHNTFEFLPQVNFTYVDRPTVLSNTYMLVPWTHLRELEEDLENNSYKELILVSHARCTIPPYIQEEVSIKALSESFKEVILGDIHTQPVLPFSNVRYTTSPSSVSFTPFKKDSHGLVLHDTNTGSITWVPFKAIPGKFLVHPKNFKDAVKVMKMKPGLSFRKVRYVGTPEEIRELQEIPTNNTIKELTVLTDVIETESNADRLKEFLGSNIDISTYAFNYFEDALNIKGDDKETIRMAYEHYVSQKGIR